MFLQHSVDRLMDISQVVYIHCTLGIYCAHACVLSNDCIKQIWW